MKNKFTDLWENTCFKYHGKMVTINPCETYGDKLKSIPLSAETVGRHPENIADDLNK